jgi:hypothetical protein
VQGVVVSSVMGGGKVIMHVVLLYVVHLHTFEAFGQLDAY